MTYPSLPPLPQGHIRCPAHSVVWRYLRRWSTLVFSICSQGPMETRCLWFQGLFRTGGTLTLLFTFKPNSLTDIPPAMMGLFGINREWRFGVCNKSPAKIERTLLCQEKKVGGATVSKEPLAFHWLSPCERRGVFPLPVGLCYVTEHQSSPFWSPDCFNWVHAQLIFLYFPKYFLNICLRQETLLVAWGGSYSAWIAHAVPPMWVFTASSSALFQGSFYL